MYKRYIVIIVTNVKKKDLLSFVYRCILPLRNNNYAISSFPLCRKELSSFPDYRHPGKVRSLQILGGITERAHARPREAYLKNDKIFFALWNLTDHRVPRRFMKAKRCRNAKVFRRIRYPGRVVGERLVPLYELLDFQYLKTNNE